MYQVLIWVLFLDQMRVVPPPHISLSVFSFLLARFNRSLPKFFLAHMLYILPSTARVLSTSYLLVVSLTKESFNDWGGDWTIPSPGRSPKQPRLGIGLHDPLYGRQALSNSTHFTRGLVKCVPKMRYFRAVRSQNGDKLATSPPHSLNGSKARSTGLPARNERKCFSLLSDQLPGFSVFFFVCFLPIHSGHQGFLIHLLSAVRALIFLARRIQPFLSLVDCEIDFCVLTI